MASDNTAPAGQHRSRRADIPALAAGFGSGLIGMTFGPVLTMGLILGCSFPIVPLVIGSLFGLLAVARKDRRLRCIAEGFVAAALFGIASCAVFLLGAA